MDTNNIKSASLEQEDPSNSKLPFSYSSSSPSSSPSHPMPSCTSHQHQHQHTSHNNSADHVIQKEHMFDKVVTPSDVGKLNRLVIPKQHAEKYFPLDSSSNDKGLLLNFEDAAGKSWRFRYSYWNSSQSYVMTKGWSRFVKDKKLDAGDTVSFQRGLGDAAKDRLYIDWRRRPDAPDTCAPAPSRHNYSSVPWSPLLMRPPPLPRDHFHLSNPNRISYHNNVYYGGTAADYGYGYNNIHNYSSSAGTIVYMRSSPQEVGTVQWEGGAGGGVVEPMPMVFESVPVVQGKAAAKRLRLFGVNMDCPIPDSDPHQSAASSHRTAATLIPQQQQQQQHPLQLRLYNGTPLPSAQFLHKGKSSMSLDLDI